MKKTPTHDEPAEREPPAMATSVYKRPDGLWVARVYSVEASGKAKIVQESTPDLRAMALERMQIWASDLFLT